MQSIDIAVVGTGWYGLAAAKTYIELHPNVNIAVFEAGPTVGGVWSQERVYPGLQSNNLLGTYEYPDFPMDEATYGVKQGEHIPGETLHRYLTDYATRFGVYKHIHFNTRVDTVSPAPDNTGWVLALTSTSSPPTPTTNPTTLTTAKLILATGLTSTPHIPSLPGHASFTPPLFHTSALPTHTASLTTATTVVVLGASKSAYDAVYASARAGATVHMVIRPSGRGPVWMAPPHVTPFRRWLEKLVHTRLLTWFSPCVWGGEDGSGAVRGALHETWAGRKVVDAFWWVLSSDMAGLCGFDAHAETAKLRPWCSAFWTGSGLGILNYPTDWFEEVRRGRVRVHVAEVVGLEGEGVVLGDGEVVRTDALVCATGWVKRPSVEFEGIEAAALGLPSEESSPEMDELVARADATILARFPRLKDQPASNRTDSPAKGLGRPFRLYRFMVPPVLGASHNLAFAGMVSDISTSICASVQALWISAYLDGKLSRTPSSSFEAQWETMLHTQFGKWRCPMGYGEYFPDFVFDALPYYDMLLRDLGLEGNRKSGWRDILQPYGPEDYRKIVEKWETRRSAMESQEKKEV